MLAQSTGIFDRVIMVCIVEYNTSSCCIIVLLQIAHNHIWSIPVLALAPWGIVITRMWILNILLAILCQLKMYVQIGCLQLPSFMCDDHSSLYTYSPLFMGWVWVGDRIKCLHLLSLDALYMCAARYIYGLCLTSLLANWSITLLSY